MAMEPKELKILVEKCHTMQVALGSKERKVSEEEYKQRLNMRRSVVSTRNILKGEVIKRSDLYAKRPGTGISPEKIDELVGKIAANDISEDTIIKIEDLI